MEVDWEVEVGGGAPVIEALWPGFVDLRRNPERLVEIAEAAAFPPLARLLLALNAAESPVWTAKCDVWEPELSAAGFAITNTPETPSRAPTALACYIDLLPRAGLLFAQWQQAESFCRAWVAGLEPVPMPDSRVELIVRQAVAGDANGFGVTAYLSGMGQDLSAASQALAAALDAFVESIPQGMPPVTAASKLQ
jgi:hypothetical protein